MGELHREECGLFSQVEVRMTSRVGLNRSSGNPAAATSELEDQAPIHVRHVHHFVTIAPMILIAWPYPRAPSRTNSFSPPSATKKPTRALPTSSHKPHTTNHKLLPQPKLRVRVAQQAQNRKSFGSFPHKLAISVARTKEFHVASRNTGGSYRGSCCVEHPERGIEVCSLFNRNSSTGQPPPSLKHLAHFPHFPPSGYNPLPITTFLDPPRITPAN